VTSEQPAHQGHTIVDAGSPSTIDVNQHTLAIALRIFCDLAHHYRLWLITTTGKPPAS
jgi:hypothetical protein